MILRTKLRPQCPIHKVAIVRKHGQFGDFWACPHYPLACDRTAHKSSFDGCWHMSDQETRNARKEAHAAFDPLWKEPKPELSRTAAYRWLARAMNLTSEACHVGQMNIDQCRQVVALVNKRFKSRSFPFRKES